MISRIRYFLSTPKEIWIILLILSAVFSLHEIMHCIHYLHPLKGIADEKGEPFAGDFIIFWTGVLLLKNNDIQGIYSFASFHQKIFGGFIAGHWWTYPPPYLFLLWPLIIISNYKTAYAIWSAFNLAVFAFAVFWRNSVAPLKKLIILCAPSIIICLYTGQNGLLTAALLFGGFRLMATRPELAGILFGLLLIKPQFGILIPFILLALKNYKAFFSAACTVVVLFLASIVCFGWESWQSFFQIILHHESAILEMGHIYMISVYAATQSLGWASGTGKIWQIIIAVLFTTMLCFNIRKFGYLHWTEWLKLAIIPIYLVTPYAQSYDMCALSAAWFLWLNHQQKDVSPLNTVVWIALLYVPLCNTVLNYEGFPITPLLLILAFFLAWKDLQQLQRSNAMPLAKTI